MTGLFYIRNAQNFQNNVLIFLNKTDVKFNKIYVEETMEFKKNSI